jgi:hypothetical protein
VHMAPSHEADRRLARSSDISGAVLVLQPMITDTATNTNTKMGEIARPIPNIQARHFVVYS